MKLTLSRDAEVDALLGTPSFLDQWHSLWTQCPWATPFQAPPFTRCWYRTYRARMTPLLLTARDADDQLVGLLAVAHCHRTHRAVVVGTHQAEYQVWICRPEVANQFPPEALRLLRQREAGLARRAPVKFHYLPPGVPLDWATAPGQGPNTLLQEHRRPLLKLGDGTEIEASLRKSGNKSRLRQLRKLGTVSFTRTNDPAEARDLLAHARDFHDFRQIVIGGRPPFRDDPLKALFHQALLDEPDQLHVTALRIGPHVASVHLNVPHRDPTTGVKSLQLGLIGHNPLFGHHSPGKLHVLMLAQLAHREGFETIDLTPGGEAYKERFANAGDTVRTLTCYPGATSRALGVAMAAVCAAGKFACRGVKITPATARGWYGEFRRTGLASVPLALVRACGRWLGSRELVHLYALDRRPEANGLDVMGNLDNTIRRDIVADLLAYPASIDQPDRQQFLAAAEACLDLGLHCYTATGDDRLAHLGWFTEQPTEPLLARVLPGIALPANTALIVGLHTFTGTAPRGLRSASLRQMLRHASAIPGHGGIYAAIPAHDLAARAAVSLAGFRQVRTIERPSHFAWNLPLGRITSATPAPPVTPASATRPPGQRLWAKITPRADFRMGGAAAHR